MPKAKETAAPSLHLVQRKATPTLYHWVTVLPAPNPPPPILALTSSGSQMPVEGNISLAHGQEVRADI